MNSLRQSAKTVDPRYYNGAMLVGLNGVVVKSHGSTDAFGFANAIKVAISLVQNKINEKITAELKQSLESIVTSSTESNLAQEIKSNHD